MSRKIIILRTITQQLTYIESCTAHPTNKAILFKELFRAKARSFPAAGYWMGLQLVHQSPLPMRCGAFICTPVPRWEQGDGQNGCKGILGVWFHSSIRTMCPNLFDCSFLRDKEGLRAVAEYIISSFCLSKRSLCSANSL